MSYINNSNFLLTVVQLEHITFTSVIYQTIEKELWIEEWIIKHL
jgi:hypothetical protein